MESASIQSAGDNRSDTSTGYLVDTEYKVYKRRWFYVLVVALLNISNAAIWISFSPIAYKTATFYNVGSMGVNWLSLVYLVASIPCGLAATWLIDTMGLRTSILLGTWLNLIGSILRVVSTLTGLNDDARYPIVITGQSLAAVAQPLVMFTPTKLAGLWFSDNQRATANTLASMANPVGILLANVLSPALLKEESDMKLLMLIYTAPAALVTLLATFGVCSSVPPTPPTASAAESSEPFCKGLKRMRKMKSYWILCFVFGGGLGLVTTLSTLFEQILCPRNYTDSFSGLCGALMIAGGIVGAGIAGAYVDKTKKFEEVAKLAWALAALSLIAFTEVSRLRGMEVAIAVTVTLFGFFGFSLYPISLELGVECTYPVAEATSAGFLIISGQIQGIVFIIVMGLLAQDLPSGQQFLPNGCVQNSTSVDQIIPQDYTVPNLSASGLTVFFVIVFLMFFKADYRRLRAEQKIEAEKILTFSSRNI
ncbi:solute carrier family 49 member A3-like [Liolophura sinensis]|uniref:solute carrier family 49 member A3-like n=1 Tax=Liolophura sinensis TaxID=3198878 RepID=UPI003158BBE5